MRRREFLGTALAAAATGTLPAFGAPGALQAESPPTSFPVLPKRLAGMSLEQLRDDYRDRLFRQYLPFWDKGGYDKQRGGFTCELNDDGSVAADEKFIWYQGRAIWIYSFLYQHFGKDPRWLQVAAKTHHFMVRHMDASDGRWHEKTKRDGTVVGGLGKNVYGWLFAAAGLAEYYAAAGDEKDLQLAKESIWAAVRTYDDPGYGDTHTTQYTAVEVPAGGLRSQGHSMLIVWILSRLLACHDDPRLVALQREHVDHIMSHFWNPDYGITNEYLHHDYRRIPSAATHMFAGHSLESLWIVMREALRIKDQKLFDTAAGRIRRLLEMCWDYVFEGWADGDYFVFDTPKHRRGPQYEVKTMWAHCEVLIACLMVLEYTGAVWAKEWYERARAFTLKTMPVEGHGVWRQAVDRFGKDLKRVGVSTKRKGNFHQPRMLMMNLLSLDRVIDNGGKLSPFPR